MSAKNIKGGDFVDNIFSYFTGQDSGLANVLKQYVTFGSLNSETWNTVPYDSELHHYIVQWSSKEGSAVKIEQTQPVPNDSYGLNKLSLSILGKLNGANFSSSSTQTISATNESGSGSIAWKYSGDKATASDDFTLAQTSSWNIPTDSTKNKSRTNTLTFSNSEFNYQVNTSMAGTNAKYAFNITKFNFEDLQLKTSLLFTGSVSIDANADTAKLALINTTYRSADYSMITTNFSVIKSVADFNSLPEIGPSASNFEYLRGALSTWGDLLTNGDNKITITSTSGVSVDSGAGKDTIVASTGNDTIIGGAGNDSLTGGTGADSFVLAGSDTVADYKGTQSDTVDVSSLATGDTVTFTTVAGALDLSASTSAAAFKATAAAAGATITGGSGADSLTGAGGIDYLFGGTGKDTLSGGAGNDVINGGDGSDSLTGGAGSDKFVFNVAASSTNNDTITDFAVKDDKIQLSKTVFTGFSAVGSITSTAFLSGAGKNTATTADQKLIYDSSSGKLYYDADGSGSASAIQIALIGNKAALTSSAFEIIS